MNRVMEKLAKLSDELHEMEISGAVFTDEEENLWEELTHLMVNNRFLEE